MAAVAVSRIDIVGRACVKTSECVPMLIGKPCCPYIPARVIQREEHGRPGTCSAAAYRCKTRRPVRCRDSIGSDGNPVGATNCSAAVVHRCESLSCARCCESHRIAGCSICPVCKYTAAIVFHPDTIDLPGRCVELSWGKT